MISWWWLVVEACVLVLWGAYTRGATRTRAIIETLADPEKQRAEVIRRAGGGRWSDDDCRSFLRADRWWWL